MSWVNLYQLWPFYVCQQLKSKGFLPIVATAPACSAWHLAIQAHLVALQAQLNQHMGWAAAHQQTPFLLPVTDCYVVSQMDWTWDSSHRYCLLHHSHFHAAILLSLPEGDLRYWQESSP